MKTLVLRIPRSTGVFAAAWRLVLNWLDFWLIPWLTLPLTGANMLPVLCGRNAKPIEEYAWWPKRWPLGPGKTLRGFVLGGLLAVMLVRSIGLIVAVLTNQTLLIDVWNFNHGESWLVMSTLAFGALTGDVIKSIIKRRFGFQRGQAWWPYDQLDAVLGGFLLTAVCDWSWFSHALIARWPAVLAWIAIYMIAHPIFSWAAHAAKLKSVPN